ncbi:MAG: hypothetical protein ACLFTK_06140, partial [Anaerolineales bacterium]
MSDSVPPPTSGASGPPPIYDIITALMVIGSVLVLGGSLLIVANPAVPFNPLPLPTLPPRLSIPSATPTSTATHTPTITPTSSPTLTPTTSATFTPSPTASPTATPTITPTATMTPSPTLTPTPVLQGLPTRTPLPSPTTDPAGPTDAEGTPAQPGINLPGGPQPGSNPPPLALNSDAGFPFMAIERNQVPNPNTEDCNWLSIAGTVTGLLGEPLTDIAVEVSGDQFLEVRFSGTAPAWGPSGFEINVGNRPAAREFAVRLLS